MKIQIQAQEQIQVQDLIIIQQIVEAVVVQIKIIVSQESYHKQVELMQLYQ